MLLTLILLSTALGITTIILLQKVRDLGKALSSSISESKMLADKLENESRAAAQQVESIRVTCQGEIHLAQTHYKNETDKFKSAIEAASAAADRLVDQHRTECAAEIERVRQHYQTEAEKIFSQARLEVLKLESLRKYEAMQQEEEEARQQLLIAVKEAESLRQEAGKFLEHSRAKAKNDEKEAWDKVRALGKQAEAVLEQATFESRAILEMARRKAEQISGDAYVALQQKQSLQQALESIHNTISGFGDRYVVPTHSILDDLAADYGHIAGGESLGIARERSRNMVVNGEAAACDYVETSRRETAIRFVIDAFNGRVDAILSRAKEDNFGILEQEIRDAFNLVNLNGEAFRNARILPEFLEARIAELKYAVIVHELRKRDREEQRRIQEQIREEEKARREYERAMREAAKEEETLKKAIEKAEALVQHATSEQKARYEQQLKELAEKLKLAEEKNQRAISMAQQTRRGHVYIISNIGSLGEHVYKIGLTRRLDPLERIDELGDSSVPFDFDVHAMIFSEDAPALELQLHNHFLLAQVNKVNHRKEFFRIDLNQVRKELERIGIIAKWTMTAAAAQYRETLVIEKLIQDPRNREAWVKRQLELEVLEPLNTGNPATPASEGTETIIEHDRRDARPVAPPVESF